MLYQYLHNSQILGQFFEQLYLVDVKSEIIYHYIAISWQFAMINDIADVK